MYGLVNQAIEGFVTSSFGEKVWESIKAKAGVLEPVFMSNEPYPDEVTFALVVAGAKELKLTPDQVLEAFGEYWVLFTAQEGYGALLEACGSDLKTFMRNLPNLHSRMSLIFPQLRIPEFSCFVESNGNLRVEYRSSRSGLSAFVVGLFKGLSKRFHEPTLVHQTKWKGKDGAPCDEFMVEFAEALSEAA